jgi:hypothetical protein
MRNRSRPKLPYELADDLEARSSAYRPQASFGGRALCQERLFEAWVGCPIEGCSDCGGLFIGEYDGSGCIEGSNQGDQISNDGDDPSALGHEVTRSCAFRDD